LYGYDSIYGYTEFLMDIEFKFEAKLRETERQIGNAVPPVLAWHIAQSVKNCLL